MAQVFRKEDFGMADERKDLDKDFQQDRKAKHMADPNKNKGLGSRKPKTPLDAIGRSLGVRR